MLEKYVILDLESGAVYVRRDKIKSLKAIDVIIFDCDGVLIDIRNSYDKAISKAVAQIFEWLTGNNIPEGIISPEIIFLFRRSGGFNNDWDIVYGILMFLICGLPREFREKIGELIRVYVNERDAVRRLLAVKNKSCLGAGDLKVYLRENLVSKLRNFTRLLDATGIASVDRAMLSSGEISNEFYNLLKSFLHGSGRISDSIIARVFEEIFCGSNLFEEVYGIKPEIYDGPGIIENGKPIIKHETLSSLSSMLGGLKFGIASGSRLKSARHILGNILEWFNPEAQIFLDNIEKVEDEYAERGLKVSLKKPNPFSLFKSAEALEPFRFALYVGDSMEDAIMVENARRIDPSFLFAGVYEYTSLKDKAIEEFISIGSDLILPSVNEIPSIIDILRRWKN
jgi:phosphoglycolate phosphatase-like HAD superfamily hydrolase